MKKTILAGFAVMAISGAGAVYAHPQSEAWNPVQTALTAQGVWGLVEKLRGENVLKASCCKTCRKGKACGDSCISKSKSCHAGRGCACNG